MTGVIATKVFEDWLRQLRDRRGKVRILERIDRLAHGNAGDVKPVGHGVSELRIHHGPGYRIYFLRDGASLLLLLCGGDKSSQRRDVARAIRLAEEWRTDRSTTRGRGHE